MRDLIDRWQFLLALTLLLSICLYVAALWLLAQAAHWEPIW